MRFKNRSIDYISYSISSFIILFPFIYTSTTLDPVLTLRFLLFSTLTFLICLFSINQKIDKAIVRDPIVVAFSLLLFLFIISSIINQGVPSESIYITIKLATLLIFLILSANILKDNTCRERIFLSVSFFTLICCSMYAIEFINGKINNENYKYFERLSATMANKNLLSSVLFLTIPFNVYNANSKNNIKKVISIISLSLVFLVCVSTMSKATLLAILILFISILILRLKKPNLSKIYFLSIVLIFIFSLPSVKYISVSEVGTPVKIKNLAIKYFQDENMFTDKRNSFSARLHLYQNTLDLITHNPILGVGPGNWKIQHGKYSLYLTLGENGRKLVQRPHNDFLWIASESGIIAGIIYLMIFLVALNKILRNNTLNNLYTQSIFGVVLGYFIISLFDFPMERVAHNLLFFLLLSGLISNGSIRTNSFLKTKHNKLLSLLFSVILLFSVFVANARHTGEKLLTKAKLYKGKNSWKAIIRNVDKAYSPYFYEIDRSGTPIFWYRGVANFSLGNVKESLNDFKLSHKLNRYHLHVLNNLATNYEILGKRNIAIDFYKQALKISPRFEDASVNLSAIYFNQKKYNTALDVILRCNLDQWRLNDYLKYDKYLKTISQALINSYLTENRLSPTNEEKLNNLKEEVENDFKLAKQTLRELYEKRKTQEKPYLELYLNY